MTDEVWWTRCDKCHQLLTEHTSVTWTLETDGRVCPTPKLADVVPLPPPKETA